MNKKEFSRSMRQMGVLCLLLLGPTACAGSAPSESCEGAVERNSLVHACLEWVAGSHQLKGYVTPKLGVSQGILWEVKTGEEDGFKQRYVGSGEIDPEGKLTIHGRGGEPIELDPESTLLLNAGPYYCVLVEVNGALWYFECHNPLDVKPGDGKPLWQQDL